MSQVFPRGSFLCLNSLWKGQRKMAGAFASATVSVRLAAELILSSLMTVSYLIARGMAPSVCRIIAMKFCYAGQYASPCCLHRLRGFCLYGRAAQVSQFGNAYDSQGRLCINSLHGHCLACYSFYFFSEK